MMVYSNPARQREFQRNWIQQRRQTWMKENGPCVKCGSWDRLELHHRDRTQKTSHRIWSWSLTRINEEAMKCDVLCHECHKFETHVVQRQEGFLVHGSDHRGYGRGCRCELCRKAHAQRKAAWRQKRRLKLIPTPGEQAA